MNTTKICAHDNWDGERCQACGATTFQALTPRDATGRFVGSGIVSAKCNGACAAMQYVRKSATARSIEDAGVTVGATVNPPIGAVGVALASPEQHTPGPCACRVEIGRDRGLGPDGTVVYCPLHAAAPEMLSALLEAVEWLDALKDGATTTGGNAAPPLVNGIADWLVRSRAAIRAATEGAK